MSDTITINQINQAIMFGGLTNDQLNSIVAAVKFRRGELVKQAKRKFTVGATVKFYSASQGQTHTGTLEKMAKKFATVNTRTGRWCVPANLLEEVNG